MLNTSSNIGSNKSFVYDLNKELGIVRMRVALCHDLLRLSLCSGDLFITFFISFGVNVTGGEASDCVTTHSQMKLPRLYLAWTD